MPAHDAGPAWQGRAEPLGLSADVGKGHEDMATFQPRNPDFRAFLQGYVGAQRYLRLIGAELTQVEPGVVVFRVPYRDDLGQQDGYFHGGVVGSVAEAVMGAAAASLVAKGDNVVGAEYKVNLLSPGRGAALIARGSVVKPGRRLIVCRADVAGVDADGAETLVAIAQGAMAVISAA